MKILSGVIGQFDQPKPKFPPQVTTRNNHTHYSIPAQNGNYSLLHVVTEQVNAYYVAVTNNSNDDLITIVKSSPHSCVFISLKNTFQFQCKLPNQRKILLHDHNSIYINSIDLFIEIPIQKKNEHSLFILTFPYQQNLPTMSKTSTPIDLPTMEGLKQVNEKIQLTQNEWCNLLANFKLEKLIEKETQKSKGIVTYGMGKKMYVVKNYLETNFLKSDLTLDNIAKETGININTIKAHFRDIYGHTVHDYINILKMQQAKKLLRDNTADKISAIAEHLGYDVSTFNRQFQAHYNMTPTEYKEKNSNNK